MGVGTVGALLADTALIGDMGSFGKIAKLVLTRSIGSPSKGFRDLFDPPHGFASFRECLINQRKIITGTARPSSRRLNPDQPNSVAATPRVQGLRFCRRPPAPRRSRPGQQAPVAGATPAAYPPRLVRSKRLAANGRSVFNQGPIRVLSGCRHRMAGCRNACSHRNKRRHPSLQ